MKCLKVSTLLLKFLPHLAQLRQASLEWRIGWYRFQEFRRCLKSWKRKLRLWKRPVAAFRDLRLRIRKDLLWLENWNSDAVEVWDQITNKGGTCWVFWESRCAAYLVNYQKLGGLKDNDDGSKVSIKVLHVYGFDQNLAMFEKLRCWEWWAGISRISKSCRIMGIQTILWGWIQN